MCKAPTRAPSFLVALRMKSMVDLEQLMSVIADAVIVVGVDGAITLWNPAATRLFGYAEAEALGQSLSLIIPERLRHRHYTGFAHSMQTGTTRYGEQLLKVPATHKDGRILSIAFTVAMLFDASHAVTGVAAVIRDETARFKAEREISQRLTALEQQLKPTVVEPPVL
jgi:PAS domain S-box-containing protein